MLAQGQEWVFILLKEKPGGDGTQYWLSEAFEFMDGITLDEVSSPKCGIIAGILAHWVNETINSSPFFYNSSDRT